MSNKTAFSLLFLLINTYIVFGNIFIERRAKDVERPICYSNSEIRASDTLRRCIVNYEAKKAIQRLEEKRAGAVSCHLTGPC